MTILYWAIIGAICRCVFQKAGKCINTLLVSIAFSYALTILVVEIIVLHYHIESSVPREIIYPPVSFLLAFFASDALLFAKEPFVAIFSKVLDKFKK